MTGRQDGQDVFIAGKERTWCTFAYFSRFFPVLPWIPLVQPHNCHLAIVSNAIRILFVDMYICTKILHFSLSHFPPFSGLPFHLLNLALTGTQGSFGPALALSSIYQLSRLDRKRKTPSAKSDGLTSI